MNDETKIVGVGDDYKDVSGLLEDDVSKVDTDEKISVADKIDIGDKIEIVKPIKPIKPIRMPKFAAMRTMAEYSIPTPVTRKEMYLNVIAGGVSALPTPITREEIYLAKICGMDVTIPIPLTRYEMYLYKLAGGEWDVPAPVTRIEKYLYHNCGYEIEVPEPITREEIYWSGGQPQPTTIEGVPPLTFTAKRTGNLEDYAIYGNTVQNGTPSPDSPIEPEFVGDLVSIELDEPLRAIGDYKDTLDLETKTYTKKIRELVLTGEENWYKGWNAFLIDINDSKTVAAFESITVMSNRYMSITDRAASSIGAAPDNIIVKRETHHTLAIKDSRFATDAVADFKSYLAEQYANGTPVIVWYVLAEPIVTTLSSIPDGLTGVIEGTVTQDGTPTPDNPIEPVFNGTLLPNGKYQVYKTYKIPISSAGQTNNIYLGEVETTRKIKKLVLTGEEGIHISKIYSNAFVYENSNISTAITRVFSTHLEGSDTIPTGAQRQRKVFVTNARGYVFNAIAFGDWQFLNDSNAFKAWLAQQYANGTPVTIWYVLATPKTAIVNEPLCKIGDYADSVDFSQAGVEIPATAGTNTLSVGTEIQPSNMMISYK